MKKKNKKPLTFSYPVTAIIYGDRIFNGNSRRHCFPSTRPPSLKIYNMMANQPSKLDPSDHKLNPKFELKYLNIIEDPKVHPQKQLLCPILRFWELISKNYGATMTEI